MAQRPAPKAKTRPSSVTVAPKPRAGSSGRDKLPVREKGKRTRENILAAAEVVFERDGYLSARVADIAGEANVAHGTFYTYFDSKEDVFRDVASTVVGDIYRALDAAVTGQPARELVHAANSVFLELYERHATMLGLIEQVATFDDHFRDMRLQLRHRLVHRTEQALKRMAESGESDLGGFDQHIAANALAGMVENFAYAWFILKEPFDADAAVETLDGLWVRAAGIRPARRRAVAGAPPVVGGRRRAAL